MAIDARKNFAKCTVSTGYDASATSIALTSGHGARLPAVPFNAVWWNSTDYPNPADDPNVEIVRVTARSTDTLTVTRAQESTSATTKNTAAKTYLLLAAPTKKMIDDIETDIAAAVTTAADDATTKANAAQAAAIQRSNHTGTQAISTVTGLQTALDNKAPLASPALTGTPTAPTAAADTSTTQIATTAFAKAEADAAQAAAATDATTKADAAKARATHTGTQLMATISDAGTAATKNIDTDGTLAANSDTVIPTQKAVKTYADQLIASADAMVFKGVIDCSANPNYPAADRGHTYRVSVAGKIGGASGTNVEVGDLLLCLTDGTASGTQAGVGTAWSIAQTNLDGAVIGPASATDNHLAQFDGTSGKLLKGGIALDTDTALAADSDTRLATQKAVKAYADAMAALASVIHAKAGKTTPVDADEFPLIDSAASNVLKVLTWANLKATLKTYFDTLYQAISASILAKLHVHGSDVASSGTIDLDAATGELIDVTGTTTITAITLANGLERTVRFTGALTLTHGASLVLPGGANITTAAGDFAVFRGYASSVVRCVAYTKANGQAVVGGAGGMLVIQLNTGNYTYTNMAAALAFWRGEATANLMDLSSYTQVRFVIHVTSAGVSGAKLIVRYKTSSYSATATDYSDIGTSEVSNVLTSTGIIDTGWVALASGAIAANIYVAVLGSGGDGAVDPIFRNMTLQFK